MFRKCRALLQACLVAIPLCAHAAEKPQGAATWINPVDLDYKYTFELTHSGISLRTGADPAIVLHKDAYYLFMTSADGYWRSPDLVRWDFLKACRWPFSGNVAPAAASDGKKIYVLESSFEPRPLLSTTVPETGRLEFEERILAPLPNAVPAGHGDRIGKGEIPPGPWDPALFRDDDGRWYLYWGSSDTYPIYGIELDPRKHWAYVGTPAPLIAADPARHGWERFGRDHRDSNAKPWVEGAWMTKHGGRYYLQYAAPGTRYNVYANGVYVSDHPLGPFHYAPYNPISYKPGGFTTGSGHGSTFQDRYGNWWNSGTSWIGLNWPYERRIAMHPAGFYPDGQMYVSTRFGDFPHWAATGTWRNPDDLFTGWMLLSYRKTVIASSTLGEFVAANVTDEDPRTIWVAGKNSPGETLTVDLGREMTVRAVQVNFADYKSGRYSDGADIWTAFEIVGSKDGVQWSSLAQASAADKRDRPNAYLPVANPQRIRFVRYLHGRIGGDNLAISDFRIFGNSDDPKPGTPSGLRAKRQTDDRNTLIRWNPVPGVTGYNVRWGTRPDRLNQTYQIWADTPPQLELRALTTGQRYWIAIESFNAAGVSKISKPVAVR